MSLLAEGRLWGLVTANQKKPRALKITLTRSKKKTSHCFAKLKATCEQQFALVETSLGNLSLIQDGILKESSLHKV